MGDCARGAFTYISIGFQVNLIYDLMESEPQDIVNLRAGSQALKVTPVGDGRTSR
jgi:hypothetical protein